MTVVTLINTGRTGVVYDEAGHTVGGGDRVEISEINPVAQAAIDIGQLRCEVDEEPPGKAAGGKPGASRAE